MTIGFTALTADKGKWVSNRTGINLVHAINRERGKSESESLVFNDELALFLLHPSRLSDGIRSPKPAIRGLGGSQ